MQQSVNLIIAKEYFGKLTEDEKLLFYKDVDQQLNTTQNARKTQPKRKAAIRSEFTTEYFFKELCNRHNEKVKKMKAKKNK